MPPPPGMARGYIGQILVTWDIALESLALAVGTTLARQPLPCLESVTNADRRCLASQSIAGRNMLKLALRNVFRQKSHTAMTLAAIMRRGGTYPCRRLGERYFRTTYPKLSFIRNQGTCRSKRGIFR